MKKSAFLLTLVLAMTLMTLDLWAASVVSQCVSYNGQCRFQLNRAGLSNGLIQLKPAKYARSASCFLSDRQVIDLKNEPQGTLNSEWVTFKGYSKLDRRAVVLQAKKNVLDFSSNTFSVNLSYSFQDNLTSFWGTTLNCSN